MDTTLVRLDAHSAQPLYQQLYAHFLAELRAGRVAPGEKLPGRRQLAQALHISLSTVDAVYGMLTAEGYVRAVPRSGFYAEALAGLTPPVRRAARALPAETPAPPAYRWDFGTSGIDPALFPFKTWRRLQREALSDPALLNHGPAEGDADLRAAIAQYLHEFRGALCAPEQIVVGAGIEYLLGLLAQLFAGSVFALEDPGYPRARRVLRNCGTPVVPAAVDAHGLSAQALAASGAAVAYVTPSHQFPTGATMPAWRRSELLQWAAQSSGRWLIEDDYDSEFRFDGRPLPCLQGMDTAGRVLYISTFSRSIAPAIRIAYMVLPAALVPLFRERFGSYSSTVSRFEQQTLYRFIAGGHYARHLARMRTAYRARRDALCGALQEAFGARGLLLEGTHTGLHLVARLPFACSDAQLAALAAAQGVHVNALSAYRMAPAPADGRELDTAPSLPGVVLGYAGIAPPDAADGVQALARAWRAEK